MQTIIALLFALFPVVYPQLPDASTIFKQASSITAKYHTLQYSAEMTVQMTSDVRPAIKTTTKSTVYRLNPGKSRIESTGATIVSDGDNIWTYIAVSKQYTKTAAALGPMNAFGGANMPNMADLQKAAAGASKVVGEETVEVDGKARPSWVVETRLDQLPIPLPNAQSVTLAGTVVKMWLDKELGLTLRMTMSIKMSMPAVASPMQMEMEQRVTGLSIDQPLADSLFTFVPPPDAKEVTSLFAVGLPGTPGIPNRVDLSGKDAPLFDVKALNGTPYSLSSLKGKPILLDFWASWCGPCKQAMPALENMNRDYKDRGLVILGIDVGEDRGTVETFLKTTPASYPTVLGIDSDIQSQYQVSVYPTYVLIDSTGKIVAHQMGFDGETNLRNLLTKAGLNVAGSPAAAPSPINSPSGVFRVAGGVLPPSVISRVEPQYSDEARQARIQGSVTLEAIVRKDGTVEILRVVQSLDPTLDQNAIEALQQWRFRPGMKDGQPVDVALNIVVNFNLGSRPAAK